VPFSKIANFLPEGALSWGPPGVFERKHLVKSLLRGENRSWFRVILKISVAEKCSDHLLLARYSLTRRSVDSDTFPVPLLVSALESSCMMASLALL
jgi:hypothetical protein